MLEIIPTLGNTNIDISCRFEKELLRELSLNNNNNNE